MDDLFASLDAIADRIPGQIAELEAQRVKIDGDLRRLRGLQRMLSPKQVAPSHSTAAPSTKSPPKGKNSSRRSLVRVGEAIVAYAQNVPEFTALDIAARMDVSDAHVYQVFKQLREMQFIGVVGRAEPTKPGVTGRSLYRVFDADILDALKKETNNNG